MLRKLWLDEGGAIISVELILVLVIVVIGVSVGLVILRDAVVCELGMVANVINSIDPGVCWSDLTYSNTTGAEAIVQGTQANSNTLAFADQAGQLTIIVSEGDNLPATDGPITPILITTP
jgi:hypothetical protein